jgi:hypothetical protein
MAIFQANLTVQVAYDATKVTFVDSSNYGGTETAGGGAVVGISNATTRVVRVYRTIDTSTPWKTFTFASGSLIFEATGANNLPSAAYRFEFEISDMTGVTLTPSQKQDYGVYPVNVTEKAKYLKFIMDMKNNPKLRDDKTYIKNLSLFAAELDLSDFMAELGDIQSSQDAIDRINNYVVNLF